MSPDEITQSLRVLLASVTTLGLATVDGEGYPHAANVNFVADDHLHLYFISHPDTRHAVHVLRRPRIAATAYPPFEGPSEIRGVQLRGRCDPTPPAEFERVWSMFLRKFPYAAAFEDRARTERFYRVTPSWFRVIDNPVRFGYKWETAWPLGASSA